MYLLLSVQVVVGRVVEVESGDPAGQARCVLEARVGWSKVTGVEPLAIAMNCARKDFVEYVLHADLDGFEHSSWVILMSHNLCVAVPMKANAKVAVSPAVAPMSKYTL